MIVSALPQGPALGGVEFGNPGLSRMQDIRSIKMSTNSNPTVYPTAQPNQDAQIQNLPPGQYKPDNAADGDDVKQPISPQYAAIAKQRRALQVKEREIVAREKAMQEQNPSGQAISLAQLKASPLRVLLDAGVTYDQLTKEILADQSNASTRHLEAKITSLEEGFEKRLQDRDHLAEQQALREMRREADHLATSSDYELVKLTNSVPKVMELIERTYRKTGEVLDVHEAMKDVENYLYEDTKRRAQAEKVRREFAPQYPQMQQRQGMRTLTNRDTAVPSMSPKQRALAAFYGNPR
jgi:hypothetical protein